MASTNGFRHLFVMTGLALIVSGAGMCGRTRAELPVHTVGEAVETDIPFAPNSLFTLVVHTDSFTHRTGDELVLEIELQNKGTLVGRHQCVGFDFQGAGTGCATTQYHGDCKIMVPESGADHLRVRTFLRTANSATFEGLTIRVVD